MSTAAHDQQRKEQAWLDYCNLEAEGISPNPNALFDYYIRKNQEHPELRASIPTTNRSTVYQWAKEEKWKERYAQKKQNESEIALQKYDNIRQNSYGTLVSYQQVALDSLLDIVQNAKDQKVRLQAVESILDRTGLGKVPPKTTNAGITDNPDNDPTDDLPDNATEQQIIEWLSRSGGNSMNA